MSVSPMNAIGRDESPRFGKFILDRYSHCNRSIEGCVAIAIFTTPAPSDLRILWRIRRSGYLAMIQAIIKIRSDYLQFIYL
jgi:hypothetical protein